ncbi:MAG: 1-phosphofructokinase family hexose kinase, partial [Lachnospiraceae bacterium]|nr:1-phosphofructokinase family hexose kinase [Lachnospiraceae bacterium]
TKMIYTLTLNPSIDYYVRTDEFIAGGLNRCEAEGIRNGGKGINVSLTLKNLGVDSTALGFIGGFTGDKIRADVEAAGINAQFTQVNGQCSRINVKLTHKAVSSLAGVCQETEINGNGIRISEDDIRDLYDKLDMLGNGDILIMSGSVCPGLNDGAYADIMDRLSGRGIVFIVDTSGRALSLAVKKHPFLVKPNVNELLGLYNEDVKTPKEAALKLIYEGASNVLVSMGEDGAMLITDDKRTFKQAIPSVEEFGASNGGHKGIVSTIGAGDSMLAAFVAEYFFAHGSLESALKQGVYAGTRTAYGLGLH